ncbi:MAG TPA: sigma-70 family RNA polymerase sigma factor [Polyangiaceae bacterium]|nr:sigma-70 family RNA polymerase sigma factor [Polyangiaceae bacterium]
MSVRELNPATLSVDLADEPLAGSARRSSTAACTPTRLRRIVDTHYDFVWRTVRHFGVDESSAEDAAQQVMCVLARRLDEVAPGAEAAFLFSTALRVASEARRAARRRPIADVPDLDAIAAGVPSPEELVDERSAREVLRRVLDAIPFDLRVVFVLFELEELTVAQVAALIGIPVGTAASRLRRARETFHAIVRRMHAVQRHSVRGDRP